MDIAKDTDGSDALRDFLRAGATITDDEMQQCWNAAVDATQGWIKDGYTVDAPEGVLKLTHLRTKYHLKIPKGKREEAERAIAVFERRCPVAQTLKGCVTMEHSAEIIEE